MRYSERREENSLSRLSFLGFVPKGGQSPVEHRGNLYVHMSLPMYVHSASSSYDRYSADWNMHGVDCDAAPLLSSCTKKYFGTLGYAKYSMGGGRGKDNITRK